jgi:DNA mismatch repair protein MutS
MHSEFLPDSVKMTPMLKQWTDAKAKAKDAILLFRMGDFYELFADDAVRVAPVLELTLTSRDKDKGDAAVQMAGFPHQAAPQHIAKLVAAGFKVAICDQMEDPKLAKGIVKRDITQIVTPGTIIDDDALSPRENNFLVSVVESDKAFGVAAIDWSTGEFKATRISSAEALCDEVSRLSPAELLVSFQNESNIIDALTQAANKAKACRVETRPFVLHVDKRSFGERLDEWFHEPGHEVALLASAQLLRYLDEAQGASRGHIGAPKPYAAEDFLIIDAISRRHLNLVAMKGQGRKSSSLVGTMDCTKTAMGSRLMHAWFVSPSSRLDEIARRHDAVEAIMARPDVRCTLQEILAGIYDLERITAKAAIGRVTPRELGYLRDSLVKLPQIQASTEAVGDALSQLAPLDTLSSLTNTLSGALAERPPLIIQDGGIFARGYDAELDEMSDLADGGREQVAMVEARERETTGIANLKIGYTRVFGYYIEVTRSHLAKVPEHFKRKQTIANGERYVTEELMKLEELIASAHVRRQQRESVLFEALREVVAVQATPLLLNASYVAKIDVACAFAEVAEKRRFVRPIMLPKEAGVFDVTQGRHPIIEILAKNKGDVFVPNDIRLDKDTRQVVLITGPNMAGKSTVMRQVALIQILAQAGSYVPADAATLSICDRIFTRVGASDDIDEGRSTFMVEMSETAQILKHATPYSLVVLDEIGRGTSTYDGLSVAWAVAEYMHDKVRARTLFATHYHEMTKIADTHPRIQNVHVAVDESAKGIEFLYLLREGGAMRSYGIHVAALAGLPRGVLERANAVLRKLEAPVAPAEVLPQMDLFGPRFTEVELGRLKIAEELKCLRVDELTPKEALNWLYDRQANLA